MAEERYTGDEEADKRVRNTARLRRQQELNDVKTAAGNAAMRRFLLRIIEGAGYFEDSHVPGSFDLTGRKCGMRIVAKFILDEVKEANLEAYLELMVGNDKEK